jgi:hypothetical protein
MCRKWFEVLSTEYDSLDIEWDFTNSRSSQTRTASHIGKQLIDLIRYQGDVFIANEMQAPESETTSEPSKHRGLADIDAGVLRSFAMGDRKTI